jgi:hypothetical protein
LAAAYEHPSNQPIDRRDPTRQNVEPTQRFKDGGLGIDDESGSCEPASWIKIPKSGHPLATASLADLTGSC